MKFKNLYSHFRLFFFPNQQQKNAKKYFSDGGDLKFRFDYNLNSNSIIIDCGGYMGQWSSDIYSRYRSKIFVFEPVFDFITFIESRFKFNNDIKCFNYALGGSDRTEKIFLSENGSSTFGNDEEYENIKIVDAYDWILTNHINKIDLLKLNIEGGEYELLNRLIERDLIKLIDNLQIQFHDISKDSYTKVCEIRSQLSKTHKPTYMYDFVWENWEKL